MDVIAQFLFETFGVGLLAYAGKGQSAFSHNPGGDGAADPRRCASDHDRAREDVRGHLKRYVMRPLDRS